MVRALAAGIVGLFPDGTRPPQCDIAVVPAGGPGVPRVLSAVRPVPTTASRTHVAAPVGSGLERGGGWRVLGGGLRGGRRGGVAGPEQGLRDDRGAFVDGQRR